MGVRDDLLWQRQPDPSRRFPGGGLEPQVQRPPADHNHLAEFYEDFLDLNEYRYKLKAEWELVVDPETKLSIQIGAEDRYSSNPGPNTKNNDLDYYALLVWSFLDPSP